MTLPPLTQRAVAALAADAIVVGDGGRLPTSQHYQEKLGVGAGTVQQALRLLESSDAVAVESRGHQGRHVVHRDVGTLWSLGRLGPLRFVLPPPGPIELYGFLDGLAEHFRAIGVPYEARYRRGGHFRVELVASGETEAALVSRGAADALESTIRAARLAVHDLGEDTYYSEGSIVVLARAGTRPAAPLRVGIDRDSFDHVTLTQAEFPLSGGHEYVECHFTELPVALLEGRVDAGIWHRLLLLIPPELAGLETWPLREPAALTARAALSGGVIVCCGARPEVAALCATLDGAAIQARQRALLAADDPTGLREISWLR
jgi:hypothetical protein